MSDFLILLTVVLGFLAPAAAQAQNPAGAKAIEAAAALEAAAVQLDQADGARDRVKALTQTIQAFETGLSAMREGLRRAAIAEKQLTETLKAQEAEVAQFLGVLQSVGGTKSPVMLLHPEGPTGSARAGMLLAELTPALNRRADTLRRDLEDVQTLRALQSDAAQRLKNGLTQVQAARTALNQAMANRTDLPQRFTADPVRLGILIASTETLEGFASGLSEIVAEEISAPPANLDGTKGELALPVQGVILRAANTADAAGVTRPGTIIATRPGAVVTTPVAATIRYAGPLLEFGNVVILEPQANVLFVLAGLDVAYGAAGQVLESGAPVGLMGGISGENGDTLSTLRDGTGTDLTETLYIEIRQDNIPQDPALWFRTDKDG